MTTEMIQTRLENAIDRKNKKLATIEKKTKLLQKKQEMLKSAGFEDKIPQDQIETHWDLWNKTWDIEYVAEDIERNTREIDELDALIQKYTDQLTNSTHDDETYKDLPPIMKEMEDDLTLTWTENDIQRLEKIENLYKNGVSARDIVKTYGYVVYDSIRYGIDRKKIENENRRAAKSLVLDLYRRVHDITGEFVDYSDLHLSGHALNGIVVGKIGKARVETIVAGGWNIQRLHCRCLVHEIK